MSGSISIASDILGPLTVEPSSVLTFPKGLLGFPECRSFVLLPSERPNVYWLQSVEYTSLAFLLVDPFVFFDGYTLDLGATDLRSVSADGFSVLAIVTLPCDKGELPTANLQGPIVLNTARGEGAQVVLSDSSYGIRESFVL
ncbi:MAG: flagellar assembly protein FliW [Gemmatimonadota bacterium]|nr:flagellar assembly protein FliW [Gemmatimonadota bacterium]